jgi:uncharacterized membrane protein SirB2
MNVDWVISKTITIEIEKSKLEIFCLDGSFIKNKFFALLFYIGSSLQFLERKRGNISRESKLFSVSFY